QLLFNTNNLKFHRAKNSVSLYGFAGAGFLIWNTKIATQDANGNKFDFSQLNGTTKEINDEYKSWLKDAEYNHNYTRDNYTNSGKGGMTWGDNAVSPVLVGGLGLQFKLGN